jgi:hypothetical protein
MRYYPRIVTKRGTVRIFRDEWHAERWGSLISDKDGSNSISAGDLVFVCIEEWGAVPLLLRTNNPPESYGNEICRLERVD